MRYELRDHGSDVAINVDGFLRQVADALAKPYSGELDFQEAVLNVLRTLFDLTGTFRLAQSYTMSDVEQYDCTLFAPSRASKGDIALVGGWNCHVMSPPL